MWQDQIIKPNQTNNLMLWCEWFACLLKYAAVSKWYCYDIADGIKYN